MGTRSHVKWAMWGTPGQVAHWFANISRARVAFLTQQNKMTHGGPRSNSGEIKMIKGRVAFLTEHNC